jgi:gliding motility-associated-like protein
MFHIAFKKYFLLFLLFLNINLSKAQLPGKEAWHWQFGDSCALDFSSGIPVASRSSINTTEGCASISDATTGQLLFYTDGTYAWDKNNNQMPNGFGMIGGFGTSTQAALIVPKPSSSTIYYLISADQGGYQSANTGVHYSIVDMSLNGGLGDVTTKNILLTPPPTTEKQTAIKHCNGTDYWIITHPFNSNAFNVYLLNAAGINPTPVVSNVGSNQSGSSYTTIGYLKPSSDGKKLAICTYDSICIIEIYDFNATNGLITNPITLTYPGYSGFYGIEFSPDNLKLYVSSYGSELYQYDLSVYTQSAILASQFSILTIPNFIGALQLGPDGKIYLAVPGTNFLGIIESPNNLGQNCNFILRGIIVSPNSGVGVLDGLPNFVRSYRYGPHTEHQTKLCSFTSYTISASGNSNNYNWSNGDTTKSSVVHNYGTYWVNLIDSVGCSEEMDTFYITQANAQVVSILKDTAQCANAVSALAINATDTGVVNYTWSDGTTNPIKTLNDTGIYWVDYTFTNFCVSRDSFMYTTNPIPIINLGDDTTFCSGHLQFYAFNINSTYIWDDGETTPSITATKPGTYWVKVTNQYSCINSDTLVVHPKLNTFNFVLPNIVTPNNDGINDFIDFGKYQFSSLQLEIYNRWGTKVFESEDQSCIWKPTCEDGTYFYTTQYKLDCGTATETISTKGFITVIR